MFTVVATATGCLYFLDTGGVAGPAGLDAVGVLLMLFNVVTVAIVVSLIVYVAADDVKLYARRALHRSRTGLAAGHSLMQSWSSQRFGRGSRKNRQASQGLVSSGSAQLVQMNLLTQQRRERYSTSFSRSRQWL